MANYEREHGRGNALIEFEVGQNLTLLRLEYSTDEHGSTGFKQGVDEAAYWVGLSIRAFCPVHWDAYTTWAGVRPV